MSTLTWTDEKDAQLRAMWPDRVNNTLAVIGAVLGKSVPAVSERARKLGLASRVDPGGRDVGYLRREAARCGMTLPVLKQSILDAVVRDRLIDAVLDDREEMAA